MQKGVSAYFTKNILIQFFELNAQLNDSNGSRYRPFTIATIYQVCIVELTGNANATLPQC